MFNFRSYVYKASVVLFVVAVCGWLVMSFSEKPAEGSVPVSPDPAPTVQAPVDEHCHVDTMKPCTTPEGVAGYVVCDSWGRWMTTCQDDYRSRGLTAARRDSASDRDLILLRGKYYAVLSDATMTTYGLCQALCPTHGDPFKWKEIGF